MGKISNVLWGLLFVLIGVIVGLNALDITNIDVFFDGWWTLFIIVPCFIELFRDNDITGNLIGIAIGTGLLLACQDIINFEILLKLAVPFILVAIGLSIIFKDAINSKVRKEIRKLNKNDLKEYCSTFASQNIDLSNEEFTGCSLNSVFGSVNCDLRNTIIKESAVVEASSIFGGITIIVPDNINVKVTSVPIFGGVSDERKNKHVESKEVLYINAKCLFGGVKIK